MGLLVTFISGLVLSLVAVSCGLLDVKSDKKIDIPEYDSIVYSEIVFKNLCAR